MGWVGRAFAAYALLAGSVQAASPSVDVTLQAAFPSPPYLIELLEAAADENSTAYFPLLDRIAEGHFAKASTDKELYEAFLKTLREDGHITDLETLSTLKLSLSLHAAAPRIAAHYQYYNNTARPVQPSAAGCDNWLLYNGVAHCTPDLSALAKSAPVDIPASRPLPFDRVDGARGLSQAILFADITSPGFRELHTALRTHVREGKSSYKLRYKPSLAIESRPLAVGGYGVELALKRTDYIVIDDRAASEDDQKDDASAKPAVLDDDAGDDLKPLSAKELRQLSLKAGTYVLNSDDKLAAMHRLVQDFPKYSSALAAGEISEDMRNELRANAAVFLPPGHNALCINGIQILDRDLETFNLLDLVRRERKSVQAAKSLGLSPEQAIKLVTHGAVAGSNDPQEVERYDWRDEIEGGNVILWMNDLEKDRRYQDWQESVQALLTRTYPGQLPSVRKNIHHVIMPVDFSIKTDVMIILEHVQNFVKRGIPVRFGLVPITDTFAGKTQARIIAYLSETYGLATVLAYLEMILPGLSTGPKLPLQLHFDKAIHERKLRRNRQALGYQNVMSSEAGEMKNQIARDYLTRLGASGGSSPYFVNGAPIPRGDDWMQFLSNRVSSDNRLLQQGVYTGTIDDETDLPGMFLEGAPVRRNAFITPEDDKDVRIVDLKTLPQIADGFIGTIPGLAASADTVEPDTAQVIVLADFDTEAGGKLFNDALTLRKEHDNVELFLLPSSPGQAGGFIQKLNSVLTQAGILSLESVSALQWSQVPPKDQQQARDNEAVASWQAGQRILDTLSLPTGSSVIIVNGRVIGPVPDAAAWIAEDFEMLLAHERKKRSGPTIKALQELGLKDLALSPNKFARIVSFAATAQRSEVPEGIFESPNPYRTNMFDLLTGEHTSFEIGDIKTAPVQVVMSLDPTSQQAQRWLPIVKVLSELAGVHTKIFVNPKELLDELPIKRFYRYVLNAQPEFDASGAVAARGAHFSGLPKDALLTIGMDVPPAWLVSPKESVHDLDNLRLSSLKGEGAEAIYQLDNILIEGHSKDTSNSGQPPRGAQLVLSTGNNVKVADTIIMSNLGYFQFKANPGFYELSLKKGRSEQIFHIDNAGASDDVAISDGSSHGIALISFRGTTLFPRLSRKSGMDAEDVLEPAKSALAKTMGTLADTAGDVLDAIGLDGKGASSWLSRAGQKVVSLSNAATSSKAVATLPHADINIFSVASGHLYERMLNIMMVSVMKHTSHTVKFWFIEQFLSPSFKSFLPSLAEEYGFKYEMVTFKWPHWLRGQTEKQREIWGYKILFLDVLFPLDLDKVIFVDADQIVRTDMYELVQYDLKGAPYGFTPMCDSRTEMEGFRFWKTGYWKNFLRGLPYHISALYVVDLAKFRQMAAGDRLRQQYHQLSADPGSLSNLDQDLPNHMQHVLPIHSLPQEWLWCETWCSDESLGVAKTIDLCNNPQTKEPKLERARRQVPEWTIYDDEIAAVAKRKTGENTSLPGMGDGKGEQERLQAEEYQRKLAEEKAKAQADKPKDEL